VARLVEQAQFDGVGLTGEGGLLPNMIKQAVEAALQGEMTGHLGYERYAAQGRGSGNSGNGSTATTVATTAGPAEVSVPRDRAGTLEPITVPKGTGRFTEVDDMVIALHAKGLTTRDIAEWLEQTYGAKISHETVATITDSVTELVSPWRSRPLDEVYPIVYIDAGPGPGPDPGRRRRADQGLPPGGGRRSGRPQTGAGQVDRADRGIRGSGSACSPNCATAACAMCSSSGPTG
jgi:putative transposase